MAHLIAPSVLSADFTRLGEDIEMINQSEADWFHIDVMDGVFVPNISFGFPVLKAIKSMSKKPLDVHLMIVQPDRYIQDFKDNGADILTVHYEACTHLHRTLQAIRQAGMKAGVSLNPHTPVDVLEDVLDEIDLVLIMSVNPGFGGQKFINRTFEKIRRINQLREESGNSFLIEVDGGVNEGNVKSLIDCGADVLVAGNAVFAAPSPQDMIAKLKNIR